MTEQILTVTMTIMAQQVMVLSAAGEMDHDSRIVLVDAAETAVRDGRNRLIIDLAAVTFCDSGGLSLLVDLHKKMAATGGQLRLACVSPPVIAVLRSTNLDRLLALHPTVDDAIHASLPAD